MADMPKIEPGLRVRMRDSGEERIIGEALPDEDGEAWPLIIPGTEKWCLELIADGFWKWVEPVEPKAELTVSVPVSLIEGLVEDPSRPQAVADLIDLLPKRRIPRLVAIDLDGLPLDGTLAYWRSWMNEASSKPDLLKQIDDVIDEGWQRDWTAEALKAAIHRKLTGGER